MNPRLRDLIQQLGEAIHESVIESEQIAGVVRSIRRHGFDVMLMLEATIGLNDVTSEKTIDPTHLIDPADARILQSGLADAQEDGAAFSSHDVNFLKSLRISVEGDAEDDIEDDTQDQNREQDRDQDRNQGKRRSRKPPELES